MTPENQITLLRAFEAITQLSKNCASNVLFAPETTMGKNAENLRTLKYKLSIIEGIFSGIKEFEPLNVVL